jgi:hypothetical protein
MSIPIAVAEWFDPKIRARGHEYFVSGDVRLTKIEPGMVRSRVRGSRIYTVSVWADEDGFDYSCDCPYADQWDGPCKHVWATLLKADSDAVLPFPEGIDLRERDDDDDLDDDESDEELSNDDSFVMERYRSRVPQKNQAKEKHPDWKRTLHQLRKLALENNVPQQNPPAAFPPDRRIVYLVDVAQTLQIGRGGLTVEVMTQRQRSRGEWDRPKSASGSVDYAQWLSAPDEADRMIAQLLMGANGIPDFYEGSGFWFTIPGNRYTTIFKRMCDTGRCGLRQAPKAQGFSPIRWDDGEPWEFWLELGRSAGEKFVIVSASLRRRKEGGEERMTLDKPALLLAEGLVITETSAALLRHHGAWPIIQAMRGGYEMKVPVEQLDDLLSELGSMPGLPRIEIAPEFGFKEVQPTPVRHLMIRAPRDAAGPSDKLQAEVTFDYAGQQFRDHEHVDAKLKTEQRELVRRDRDLEAQEAARLSSLGFKREWNFSANRQQWMLPQPLLHRAVIELTSAGWIVEAEGSIYRRPGNAKIEIRSSGIDWFEMEGGIDFDGKIVPLPRLLEAMQKGQNVIKLDDGSMGVLPADWLAKYAPLAGLGEQTGDLLRFARTQIGVLDALLATMPEARCDEAFSKLRSELSAFDHIEAADAPEGFGGTLRPYQRDGLGWLLFLQKFSFGGCLADDMGLGKTVQVLALLEMRRRAKAGPSLVVVPRSLVFNWKAECARFAPDMRVLDHSGINRARAVEHFSQYDLVITTYGTLRRDAPYLKDVTFDYVILDEAQAIKNAGTENAKATRLLKGKNRLVLTGTPIENRLADLWSIFEFLNPGMLGAVSVFRSLVGNEASAEGRTVLARALRPFILRRTKEQVATDLPEKLEQTIFCDLEDGQRKLYDELRDHYRQSLLSHIDTMGLNKSKMHILEALLRLRQAACHPGLIDKKRADESSAKLDSLFEQLEEVLAEGHKALVFSQFTSFLSLLRTRLDNAQTTYEYLDGKTRDRQAKVERFQTDDSCKLFLISLKAGGVGLNLTAADYVFLLDPWWNPAVESQAIDRTHRIGQTRRVFAYRLIARDTVEEKVLKLQQTKRDLADAIINADNSLISELGRDDLELLLS